MISAINKVAVSKTFGAFGVSSYGFLPYASKFGETNVVALAVLINGAIGGVEQTLLAIFRSAGNNLYRVDASGELNLLGGHGYDRQAKGWVYRAGSAKSRQNVEDMLSFAKSTLRTGEGIGFITKCAGASGITWEAPDSSQADEDADPFMMAALANRVATTDIVGSYFAAIREQLGTHSPLGGDASAADDEIPF